MGWNNSGGFVRAHNFSADASAGIKMVVTRQEKEWDNFRAGLENQLTRDGQNAPSADLPMTGQRHTNVGVPTSATHYIRAGEFMRNFPIYCAFGGTAEAMSASAQFALTSLTAGVQVLLSCPSVNTTTSVTLGLTGVSTALVLRPDGKGPARGQVLGLHRYVYDGANWVLTNPSPVLGRILVASGSGSALAIGTDPVTWNTVVSAEGFSLSTNGAVMVPGGVRAVRIYAFSTMQTVASSSDGNYQCSINESQNGTSWNNPSWGSTTYAAATVFHFNNLGTRSFEVQADHMSVQQSSRVAVFLLGTSVNGLRSSCQGGYFVVEAVD